MLYIAARPESPIVIHSRQEDKVKKHKQHTAYYDKDIFNADGLGNKTTSNRTHLCMKSKLHVTEHTSKLPQVQ